MVENARIRNIVDNLFNDDPNDLLLKRDVVTNSLQEEFDLIISLKKKEEQAS